MCGCRGASLAAPSSSGLAQASVLSVPLPIGGTMALPYRAPQPLEPVRVTAKPFPWAWIVGGVVAFLVLTKGGR